MEFTRDKIVAIANDSNLDNRKKIDELLHMDCLMYAYLGTDSTDEERKAVKDMSKVIYLTIFEIDNKEGSMLINTD